MSTKQVLVTGHGPLGIDTVHREVAVTKYDQKIEQFVTVDIHVVDAGLVTTDFEQTRDQLVALFVSKLLQCNDDFIEGHVVRITTTYRKQSLWKGVGQHITDDGGFAFRLDEVEDVFIFGGIHANDTCQIVQQGTVSDVGEEDTMMRRLCCVHDGSPWFQNSCLR
ncbi:hypothetical protein D3C86_1412420 [compost metagenome]